MAWSSKQQPIVSVGTSAAELIASVAGSRDTVEVSVVLYEICCRMLVRDEHVLPNIKLRVDSTASIIHWTADEFSSWSKQAFGC